MAWPPSLSSNFLINGNSSGSSAAYVRWGTDGLYGSAIVKSMRRQDMSEEIKIENGTGLTAWFIQLVDGTEVELTCVWDSNVDEASFDIGTTLRLSNDPKSGQSNFGFLVTSNPLNLARKQEAEFSITGKYFSNINTPSN